MRVRAGCRDVTVRGGAIAGSGRAGGEREEDDGSGKSVPSDARERLRRDAQWA